MNIQRTIVPQARYFSEEIAKGVFHQKFYPGGLAGPNGETRNPVPGGQTWSEIVALGGAGDAFQMILPDIRMPANQYWPLHWHDCWTVVLIVEGSCCIGDWWMEAGDVFITRPSIEYGPLVIGPNGCRLFEIFTDAQRSRGGYSPEYHDHPTLQGGSHVFSERSDLNKRNNGRQTLPLDGVDGVWKTKLTPGHVWRLGEEGDPDASVMKDTRLAAGETLPAVTCGDWNAIVVLGGSITIGERVLGRDDLLLIQPGGELNEITGGPEGAQLLELARTTRGAMPRLLA